MFGKLRMTDYRTMSENTLLVEVEKRELLNPEPSYYQMDNATRGYCVIINFTEKTNAKGEIVEDRAGAEFDEDDVITTFEQFGFEIKPIINQSHTTIEKELKKYAAAVPRDHQCLFLFLMAHGGVYEKGEVFKDIDGKHRMENKDHLFKDIDGRIKSSNYISDAFNVNNCVELAGKPKVFVIQTCFGSNLMIGPLQEPRTKDPKPDSKKRDAKATVKKSKLRRALDKMWFHRTKGPRKEDPKPHSKEGDAIATVKPPEALDKRLFPEAIGARKEDPKPHSNEGDAIATVKPPEALDKRLFPEAIGERTITAHNVDPPHETSDMFWFRATIDGYKAHRFPLGSYFISAFCKAMRQLKKSDLHTICTQVKEKVSRTIVQGRYRQQPELIDRLNKLLMLNPGLNRAEAFSEPPSFPEQPNIESVEGTYIWPIKTDTNNKSECPGFIVVNSDSQLMIWYSGKHNKTLKLDENYRKTSRDELKGFKAGISISRNTHLVILKTIRGFKAALINTTSQWMPTDRQFQIQRPLALCEVNNDGIGTLCGAEGYDKADFYIFSRKDILQVREPDKIEHFELFYKVKAGDLVAYHSAKIYIASTSESSVLIFNLTSGGAEPITIIRYIDNKENMYGYVDLPCMIGIDKRGVIVVHKLGIILVPTTDKQNINDYKMEHLTVMQNIQHMWNNSQDVVLAQKRNYVENEKVNVLPSTPTFTNGATRSYDKSYDAMWTTNDGGIILAENNSYPRALCIDHGHGIANPIILPPDIDPINCGLATSSNEHVIITNSTEQSNNLWRFIIVMDSIRQMNRVLQDNYQPFKVFDMNQKSYGVIRHNTTNSSTAIEIRNKQTHYQEKLIHIQHPTIIQSDAVCYTPNREFYITNYRKGNVLQYDEDGVLIRAFGKPGSLRLSNSIFVNGYDEIYVVCNKGVSSFDRSGGEWLQLNKNITEASMGCYDNQNLYILHSGSKTVVTTYELPPLQCNAYNHCHKASEPSDEMENGSAKAKDAKRSSQEIKEDGANNGSQASIHSRVGQRYSLRPSTVPHEQAIMTEHGLVKLRTKRS